jgi:hypothetical protein
MPGILIRAHHHEAIIAVATRLNAGPRDSSSFARRFICVVDKRPKADKIMCKLGREDLNFLYSDAYI